MEIGRLPTIDQMVNCIMEGNTESIENAVKPTLPKKKWVVSAKKFITGELKRLVRCGQQLLNESFVLETEVVYRLREGVTLLLQKLHVLGEMDAFVKSNPIHSEKDFADYLTRVVKGISNEKYVNPRVGTIQCGIRQTGGTGHEVVAISLGIPLNSTRFPWQLHDKCFSQGNEVYLGTRASVKRMRCTEILGCKEPCCVAYREWVHNNFRRSQYDDCPYGSKTVDEITDVLVAGGTKFQRVV